MSSVLPKSRKYFIDRVCRACGQKKPYTEYCDHIVNGKVYKHVKCNECRAEGLSIYRREHPRKRLLYSARARAKRYGREFDLIEDDIIIPERCPILDIKLKLHTKRRCEESPTIDRIDNDRGYTKDNIVVCSWRANRMKNGFSLEELEKLVNFLKKKEVMIMAKVRGIANWASVQSPNTTYEPVYQVDLTVSEDSAQALKDLGLTVKKTDEGFVCKFKRKQFKADGTENKKPTVVLADKSPFDGLVGNGSEVIVQFSTYEWKNKFGSGISADLQGVQVINLVEYRAGDGEEFEDLSGGDDDEVIGGAPTKAPAPKKPTKDEFDDDLPDVL